MSKYVDQIYMVTEECCNCGMTFAMTQDFKNRRLKDKKPFYCPGGHGQHYMGKSEEQKLQDELNRVRNQRDAEAGRAVLLEQQRDNISKSYRRMRNRVSNGVCPCCNRTFQNLREHMKTQHPEMGENDQLRTLRDIFGLTQSALADEIGVNAAYISSFENEKYVPDYANTLIKDWINEAG